MNIDVFNEIYELLQTLGVPISYAFPESFEQLPCISYRISDNPERATIINNQEVLSAQACAIDTWAKTSEETINLAMQIDSVLKPLGLRRAFGNSIGTNQKVEHYSMRYEWVYNTLTKLITKD